jgi:hypothetical protein
MPDKNQNIEEAPKVFETFWVSYLKGGLEIFSSTRPIEEHRQNT